MLWAEDKKKTVNVIKMSYLWIYKKKRKESILSYVEINISTCKGCIVRAFAESALHCGHLRLALCLTSF